MTHTDPNSTTPRTSLARRRLVLLASAAVIAAGAFALGAGFRPPVLPIVPAHAAPVTMTTPAATPTQPGSLADLVAKVQPAVFSVKVEMQQPVAFNGNGPQGFNGPMQQGPNQFFFRFGLPNMPNMQPQHRMVVGEGAGFFISADGYAVTANHVVANAQAVQIKTADGQTYKARIIGTDPGTDLAVIKVDAKKTFPYVKFADQQPRVGDWVVAIGNPFGLGNTATAGIVSALARDIGTSTYDNFLQIDAPINQGNSGGPTFNMKGEVVGINDAIFTPSGGSVGIGFDVPASTAKTITAELEKSGHVTRAWLGVQVQDVTQSIADGLGLKNAKGALVAQPEQGGPAAGAGMQAGDVITAVNGTTVKDARGLAQEIATLQPGASVKLNILRHGSPQTITLTLGTMPKQQQTPPA
jgi:serine protease Do